MKAVFVGAVLALAAGPAWTGASWAKDFDLGYARTGMMLGQFRFAAWPAGLSMRCSDDADRPKEVERLLAMPRQMAALGAARCALLQVDDAGRWSAATRRIGGSPAQITATFGPDAQGTKRLVQLFLQTPREGYDGLVEHFTARLGPPVETTGRLVRWVSGSNEAVVMHEGGDTAMGIMADMRMQQAMNAAMNSRGR